MEDMTFVAIKFRYEVFSLKLFHADYTSVCRLLFAFFELMMTESLNKLFSKWNSCYSVIFSFNHIHLPFIVTAEYGHDKKSRCNDYERSTVYPAEYETQKSKKPPSKQMLTLALAVHA